MTDQMRGMAEEVDIGSRGFASLNNSQITQEVRPDFSILPGPVDPEADVVIDQDGSVTYDASKGGYVVTGSQVSFESARLVRYRPGGLNFIGAALRIPDDPPAGHFDFGLARVPYNDWDVNGTFQKAESEITLRLTSNGDWAFVIRRDSVETIIPRDPDASSWSGTPAEGRSWIPGTVSESGETITNQNGDISGRYWAFDACHGKGPGNGNRSGVDLDHRPIIILPKLIGTWYGKGPYFLAFETAGSGGFQRPFRAVAFEAEENSITNRATLPLGTRFDDGGAGESWTYEVHGRQGSGAGRLTKNPRTPWEHQPDISGYADGTTPSDGSLILAFRRSPESAVTADVNFRGSLFGLLGLDIFTVERSLAWVAFDIDFGGQTPDWRMPASIQDPASTSIQVADQDTGGNDLTADATAGSSTIQTATMVESGSAGGGGGQSVSQLDPVDQPNARTKPLGVFLLSLTGSSPNTASMTTQFRESSI